LGIKCKLNDICSFANEKIDVALLSKTSYISTENMLPNKAGITTATSLPTVNQTQAFKSNDVLISNIRPYFKKIWYATFDGGCSNDVLVLRANADIDPHYLYYLLADDVFFDYATATAKGTKMPRGDKAAIMKFEVNVYDIAVQRKIVSLLADIDAKIALNNDINCNLEQQALCIYASLIEDKPKNGCIGDYCALKSGFAFKSKWWQDSGVPVVKIGSINQDYLSLADCSYVSEDKVALAKDFIVSGGDLLIAMTGATIGKFTMVPKATKTILVNQRVGKFFLGDNPINRVPFIYSTLKQPDIITDIINRGQGSAQPNISASDILSIPCVIPQQTEINVFNEQTTPMFELIINNQYENQRLAVLRDTLLPKLMNGEIDVSEVKI
jgi:hypothetical protein